MTKKTISQPKAPVEQSTARRCRRVVDKPALAAIDVALAIYRAAGLDWLADYVPRDGSFDIARRVLHRDVVWDYDANGEGAKIATWSGKVRICLPRSMASEQQNYSIAKLLARIYIEREGLRACEDAVARLLVVPIDALEAAIGRHGLNVKALARAFAVEPSVIIERLIDERMVSAATIVSGGLVRHRAGRSWLDDSTLVDLAARNGKTYERVRLSAGAVAMVWWGHEHAARNARAS